MAIYESIVILDSLIPPKEIDTALERFSSVISEKKGKVRKVEKWGKRRLAYEIQKKQYGFYASIEFEGEGNIPIDLENEYNYNDKVLRYLTYRFDKNKLLAMDSAKIEKTEVKKSVNTGESGTSEEKANSSMETEKKTVRKKTASKETAEE